MYAPYTICDEKYLRVSDFQFGFRKGRSTVDAAFVCGAHLLAYKKSFVLHIQLIR